MAVALSYCPPKNGERTKPNDGIQLYSDHIYDTLRSLFPNDEVIYCHFEEYRKLRGKKGISHLFGISSNFDYLAKSIKPDLTCLLSVNEHALMRRSIRDLRRKRRLTRDYDDPHDGFVSNLKETKYADYVLGIGNWSVFQSYVSCGYPRDKVFITGYPYWQEISRSPASNRSRTILMYLGYICTRKGADYIEDIVTFLSEEFPDFNLKLVGFFAYSIWREEIMELLVRFPNNFQFVEGKVQYGSEQWRNLAEGTAFALFPSHEEGLAGCALDVINLGIPLIHSSKSGLEYQSNFLPAVDFENDNWREGLSRIIIGGAQVWKEIAKNQKLASFHLRPKYSAVSRALGRLIHGQIWPNVDITLWPKDKEELGFMSNSSRLFEYQVSQSQNTELQLKYIGNDLNSSEGLLMATMMIEKYTNFNSVQIPTCQNLQLSLSRLTPNQLTFPNSNAKIVIQTREYLPAAAWPTKSVRYLIVRESILTVVAQVTYQFKRYLNIFKLKISYEREKLKNGDAAANDK
jgi:hypothetical protein